MERILAGETTISFELPFIDNEQPYISPFIFTDITVPPEHIPCSILSIDQEDNIGTSLGVRLYFYPREILRRKIERLNSYVNKENILKYADALLKGRVD